MIKPEIKMIGVGNGVRYLLSGRTTNNDQPIKEKRVVQLKNYDGENSAKNFEQISIQKRRVPSS